ncbi:MAG: cyclic nucleotide-binding domain-containing protein [Dehalococcoidia bacterium]|nr:cyclic nucleotide-binding domain-containing protein [Dehalococcoidia bacterium]
MKKGRQEAIIKEVLASSELFKGLTDEELEKVAALGRAEVYEKGTTLFTEGSVAKDLYIIQVGKVAMEISLSPTPSMGKQVTVDTLSKGQICGWSAVGGTPAYILTARALEPVRVITIDGGRLYTLLKEDYYLGYRVMARMAEVVHSRLRHIRMNVRVFQR